jgi:hypothetical protein
MFILKDPKIRRPPPRPPFEEAVFEYTTSPYIWSDTEILEVYTTVIAVTVVFWVMEPADTDVPEEHSPSPSGLKCIRWGIGCVI